MSEYYIIGENRKVASISDADVIASCQVGTTTFIYWRHSTLDGPDPAAVIKMSSSTDLRTWTAPVTVYSPAGVDVSPGGVTWTTGTTQVMCVNETNTTSGAVTVKTLTSTNGTTWGLLSTVTFTEFWAYVTDFVWTGTRYYLAATVRNTFDAPMQAMVKWTANALTSNTWTSLGRVDQLTTLDNVWPRFAISGTNVHLVYREGNFSTQSTDDSILYARYNGGTWSSPSRIVTGTGNPDIATLTDGYAVIYKDQSVQGGFGIWSWMFYDGDTFVKRGTFSQGFQYGTGGWAMSTTDGFMAIYATRTNDLSTAGTLFIRGFTSTVDEAPAVFVPHFRENKPSQTDELDNFNIECQFGQTWYSLSDGLRFYVSPEDFGTKSQVHRRVTAQSPFYEGTYLIHAVRENITEQITVGVLGVSQNDVTENLLLLEDMVSQPSFLLRLTMGDHRETWSCQTADYSMERGHIMMHNCRAMMKLSVPRLPDVTYEVT
jgi:hypothetical protein